MTRDDIIKMAREAGATTVDADDPQCWIGSLAFTRQELERFAALVAAAEREACARMVDHILREGGGTYGSAIRARSKA